MSRVLNLVFFLVFASVATLGGIFVYRNYQELEFMREREAIAAGKLDALRQETQRRVEVLSKLEQDPEYVERIIRSKLNYAKKDEIIFRFE